MAGLAETYISTHHDIAEYINRQPDIRPAYDYLENTWQRWNEENDRLTGQAADKELARHFDGLTRYFLDSNAIQNQLVEIATIATHKTLLIEALLASLDQNTDIYDEQTLNEKLNSALLVLFPKGSETTTYGKIPSDLLKTVKDTQTAPDEKAKRRASAALRAHIEDWVSADFSIEPLSHYNPAIAQFAKFRLQLATEANRYQNDLIRLEGNLQSILATRGKSPIADDTVLIAQRLLSAVTNRIAETEDFRNGLPPELAPQADILSYCLLSNDGLRKNLDKSFVHEDNRKNSVLRIKDMPPIFRNLEDPAHPLVNYIAGVRQRLDILSAHSHNPLYHHEYGKVDINESGIKSWKRTIDKLEEINFDWDYIRDINRINIVFNDVSSMFHYNKLIRDIATERGWEIAPPDAKTVPNRDRGITMQSTGSWNWHMNMATPSSGKDGRICEIKLDDISQYKAEQVSHKIYECARMLQSDNHEFDPARLTAKHYEEFRNYTSRTINSLLNHQELLSPELEQHLGKISVMLDSTSGIPLAGDIYELLQEADIINCASAAKNGTPGMAALYDIKFKEMIDKHPSSKAQKLKLYEQFGPKPANGSGPMSGRFQPHHREIAQQLIQEWKKSWKAPEPQRMV